jgi:hypothetical protein
VTYLSVGDETKPVEYNVTYLRSQKAMHTRLLVGSQGSVNLVACVCTFQTASAMDAKNNTAATSYQWWDGFAKEWEASTIGRVDNSLWQSDRLRTAIAPTVPLGSFDTLPVAGTRRRGGERDGLGVRQRTCASGRWAPLELHVSRAEVDDAESDCARIALDAPTRVLSRWRRHCDPGLRAACAS